MWLRFYNFVIETEWSLVAGFKQVNHRKCLEQCLTHHMCTVSSGFPYSSEPAKTPVLMADTSNNKCRKEPRWGTRNRMWPVWDKAARKTLLRSWDSSRVGNEFLTTWDSAVWQLGNKWPQWEGTAGAKPAGEAYVPSFLSHPLLQTLQGTGMDAFLLPKPWGDLVLGRAGRVIRSARNLDAGASAWPCFSICEVRRLSPGNVRTYVSMISAVVQEQVSPGAGQVWWWIPWMAHRLDFFFHKPQVGQGHGGEGLCRLCHHPPHLSSSDEEKSLGQAGLHITVAAGCLVSMVCYRYLPAADMCLLKVPEASRTSEKQESPLLSLQEGQ